MSFPSLPSIPLCLSYPLLLQWFSEMGLPPAGNTEAYQRDQWEKPADAGSISERGKVAAASSKAKTMLQNMKDRGLKEEVRLGFRVRE